MRLHKCFGYDDVERCERDYFYTGLKYFPLYFIKKVYIEGV